jgi:uncharacterized protein YbjT (DUF2867 family)
MPDPVLLTGATGFVGCHLRDVLRARGTPLRCGARDPAKAARTWPGFDWVRFDLEEPRSVEQALRGCRAAVYLVHGMTAGQGYAERERSWARLFAGAAEACALERIVYLGGVVPTGHVSEHLQSRRVTGELLRAGSVPVFELRAAMIIGHGSISWKIVRDLAYRLPAMILPSWLAHRSQPVAVDDVVHALSEALELPLELAGSYGLPGPEALSAKEILQRIARQRGGHPIMLSVPVLTPRLSSYWLKFVTGADYGVARELVEGLSSDLLATGPELWTLLPDHHRLPFDEAVRRALAEARAVKQDTRPSLAPR